VSLFCRHNRFMADCPICSKGTVLDPGRSAGRRPRPSGATSTRRSSSRPAGARQSRGPYASAGPYDGGAEVRLERVPGGLRLAEWRAGQIERSAPVVEAADVPGLVAGAIEKELFGATDAERLHALANGAPPHGEAEFGRSPGRAGELRDELRVERLDDGRVRMARWVMRPGRGWELQEAPVLLPPTRFAQALADAAERGVLSS
jgi:hypothetical protein